MRPAASSDFPQMRARRCCELPVRSKNEATREMVPITMVESTIKGVEKSRDRRKLIASHMEAESRALRLPGRASR